MTTPTEYHQTFTDPFGMPAAIALAQALCQADNGGAPMMVSGTRSTSMVNANGSMTFDVWVTFVPAPTVGV
jgi:hypothetical protein